MIVVTTVVRRSWGEKSAPTLGRRSVPAAFFRRHAGDSGRNGRMTISGIAGISPDIIVYRQADGLAIHWGRVWRVSASARAPLTKATRNPPRDEKAWVQPSTFSRWRGSGNSSASQATAATNSTHTPMNVVQRRIRRTHRLGANPDANALPA